MSLFQFLRILAARRHFLIIALLSCVITATAASFVLPKRYKASARVLLDIVKPDPVTGQVIANQFLRAYTNTQIEMIRDQQVAGQVADDLGWTTSSGLYGAYQSATNGKGSDFKAWLGQQIIDGTKVDMVENSNILEISYTDTSAAQARAIVAAIRRAFIATALRTRRDEAGKAADWYKDQVEKAKLVLANAEAQRTQFARANHIVLQADNVDIENARLAALSSQSAAQATQQRQVFAGDTAPAINVAKTQLEQVTQQLAQTAQTLGPNHPTIQALQRQRLVLEAAVARERRTAQTVTLGDAEQAYTRQKARVVAQRDKVDQLNLMQRDIDVKRQQYMEATRHFGELRMQADATDAGLLPLGEVIVPDKPFFPNRPLIIGGATGFGLALGIVVSLLIELTRRRIRGIDDLVFATGTEVFSQIGDGARRSGWLRRAMRHAERWWRHRRMQRVEVPL